MPHESESGRWKTYLYHASRSRSFLWKLSIGTVVLAVAVGYLINALSKPAPHLFAERVLARSGRSLEKPDPERPRAEEKSGPNTLLARADILSAFASELASPDVRFEDVLHGVPYLGQHFEPEQARGTFDLLKERIGEPRARLLSDYLEAWKSDHREAYERLRTTASVPDPLRYACFALGNVEMERGNFGAAYDAFRKEAMNPQARESRWGAVHALLRAERYNELRVLGAQPGYAEFCSPYVQSKLAALDRDWLGLLKWIWRGQLQSYQAPIVTLALIAAFAWMLFLAHLGEWRSPWGSSALLCLAGFALGVLSTTPTVWLVVFEEDVLRFARGDEMRQIFLYDIGGVGLREEFCKLALFLPLLPILLRRQNELEALTVACFVGLGFAVEENAGYFLDSEAASMAGRFLSANFFHVALTGMNGLALYRVFARYRSGPNDFLYVFPLTVLAHGCYDALIDLPQIGLSGYLPMVVYIAFSLMFFDRVSRLRDNVRMTVGLSGSFVFALSLVMGAVIVYQMMNLGSRAGLLVAWSELLGSFGVVFMFFRAFDEQLAA